MLFNSSSTSGLRCYSCTYSLIATSLKTEDYFCANDTLIVLDTDLTVKPCAPWEKYCVTTVDTTQDAFSSVSRNCAETCSDSCDLDGYGLDIVHCSDCCQTNMCNNNVSVHYYISLMEARFTSWTEPVNGEREFNKKNGLRFPY
uniref:Toxin_TOLIP domain-containing protein n=1 Tax=Syphacia muris TaxID=451379 RepID=A0A0N5AXK7_9BILA